MEIVRGLESYPPDSPPSVVALGAFDGIHLAHQKILATARTRARALGLRALACTFDPHPLTVLQPERAPVPITELAENLARIALQGLDTAVVIVFTREFSLLEAEAFVKDVLVGRLKAREVVVGFNHTFGRGARGNARLLAELGPQYGFVAHVIPPLVVDGVAVSSSGIRQALAAGDVARARKFLGHPYTVRGRVLRGKGRGRQLGFPTANLRPERELIVPAGVYAARASWEGGRAGAVVNVGIRPTFGEGEYWVEAYLLDFAGDLYDSVLVLEFEERIRFEQKFPDVEALRAQVASDVATAARLLGISPARS
ncbi:MAG: riboflavin biosynthesis protein RibF [Candidatus Rokubacteria bacterium RIFCSPLOWO2_12_FULL_69_21]|nr:MAG: riboflavin biosynthesis protein RibF [Candidatus Rokubacteria bacterium RIFCSPLOWO2_12_FULL_69_21]